MKKYHGFVMTGTGTTATVRRDIRPRDLRHGPYDHARADLDAVPVVIGTDARPWRLAFVPAVAFWMLGYVAKRIDRAGLKERMQRHVLGGRLAPDAMAEAADAFADRVARTGVFAGARAQIAADRAAGYRLVMATASYRFYAARIAERLGFDAVIATESEYAPDGALLPKLVGRELLRPRQAADDRGMDGRTGHRPR